jgi:hypothetical protein
MHPARKNALLEWRTQSLYTAEADFVFPSLRRNGRKPLDLAAVLNRKIKPAFAKMGITGVGWQIRETIRSAAERRVANRSFVAVGAPNGPGLSRTGFRMWLKDMVGTWGLEPQTSTVSR